MKYPRPLFLDGTGILSLAYRFRDETPSAYRARVSALRDQAPTPARENPDPQDAPSP